MCFGRFQLLLSVTSLLLLAPFESAAEWYESTGQAIIKNNNKQLARKQATHDAIKQALLFAGASVKSVQQLTDGLLQNDQLEIRSSSEINQLQLISEEYSGDLVTITIHADIFAAANVCSEADYKKSMIVPWFKLENRSQALTGQLFDIGENVAQKFYQRLRKNAPSVHVASLQPKYLPNTIKASELMHLGRLHHAQYLFNAQITNLSVSEQDDGWFSSNSKRDFSIAYQILDLTNGTTVHSGLRNTTANYQFDLHRTIDSSTSEFWHSVYGDAITATLVSVINDTNEMLMCKPAHARILEVKADYLVIDMGKAHGVMVGDQLTLFQIMNHIDLSRQSHYRHSVYPNIAEVKQVFENTAIVINTDGLPFNNIQLNDYAVRR